MLYICGRNSTPGDVCMSSAWVADIFKRRLLALCSDSMKSRKFLPDKNLATIDVLRDIDYPSCAYFGTAFAYIRMRMAYLNYSSTESIYIRRGLRVVVLSGKAMREPHRVERQQSDSTLFILCLYLTTNPHSWEFLCPKKTI